MRERLRRRLLERGTILATLLAEVLAGKDKASALQALDVLRPGIRPEEALRKALDQVEHRRSLLVSDDDRYGCCEICGVDLGPAALEEMPWADRCHAHAAS
jgi:RNA polymerase-binding transcription factor DksA